MTNPNHYSNFTNGELLNLADRAETLPNDCAVALAKELAKRLENSSSLAVSLNDQITNFMDTFL